jgi:hypothetical protein
MSDETQALKTIEERLGSLEIKLQALESRLSKLEQPKQESMKPPSLPETITSEKRESQLSQITVTLVNKRFHKADYGLGDAGDRIDFILLFKSHLKKDVRAFKGAVVIQDLFDQDILRVTLTYEGGIRAEGTAEWRGGIKFNQFLASHQRLLSIEQKDSKVSFELESVIYADGTHESLIG